jgi:hypothetical protein
MPFSGRRAFPSADPKAKKTPVPVLLPPCARGLTAWVQSNIFLWYVSATSSVNGPAAPRIRGRRERDRSSLLAKKADAGKTPRLRTVSSTGRLSLRESVRHEGSASQGLAKRWSAIWEVVPWRTLYSLDAGPGSGGRQRRRDGAAGRC